jgi:MoxR-like ATPase
VTNKKIEDKDLKGLIEFFNNIKVEEKTLEENKNQGVLKVQVTYKLNPKFFKKFEEFKDFKNFEFTTAELCYKDISKDEVKDVKDKDDVLGSFGSSVYWLDIKENHKWPDTSEELKEENKIECIKNRIIISEEDIKSIKSIIKQISISNETEGSKRLLEEFERLLNNLYDNLRKITHEGTSHQYENNTFTNNHWHDIIKLFKLLIDKKIIKNQISISNETKEYNKLLEDFERFENFKKFLDELHKKIREITREGTTTHYGNNLVTNNHWHDIVKLIKLFIDKNGDVNFCDKEVKPYFKRMVFNWHNGKRTSLHPEFGGRKFLYDLLKNIKKVRHIMKKEEIKNLLEYKKQVILQGAPGTGKTYIAKEIAKEMTKEGGEWKIIQFHPSYTYEDFVRGIVTEVNDEGKISYKVVNKILADIAKKAKESSDKKFVLIIDEINRANLPSVLGELIYALEYRDEEVESMYNLPKDGQKPEDGKKITLPEKLYIIGTMNTTDRSIGHIDYAIRRRFAFYTLTADKSVIENYDKYKDNGLKEKVSNLFTTIEKLIKENISPDYSIDDIMIGHSYFLAENEDELKMKLEYEIKPILLEYYKDGILIDNRNNDNKASIIEQIKNLSLESKQNNQEKTQE